MLFNQPQMEVIFISLCFNATHNHYDMLHILAGAPALNMWMAAQAGLTKTELSIRPFARAAAAMTIFQPLRVRGQN